MSDQKNSKNTSFKNSSEFITNLDIPISYIHVNKNEDSEKPNSIHKPLLIFFHGFADSAQSFLRRAYPDPKSQYEILAINGPFPVPQHKEGLWKHAFAWYFSDPSTNTVYIHPKIAAKAVNDLLVELDLQNRKKFLIGFSQGAFFIPHVLSYLSEVNHIVTIGAAYRSEDYPTTLSTSVDALHGRHDEVILLKRAQESFELFKTKNPKGTFTEFEKMGHAMNSESRMWLSQKIDQVFDEANQKK